MAGCHTPWEPPDPLRGVSDPRIAPPAPVSVHATVPAIVGEQPVHPGAARVPLEAQPVQPARLERPACTVPRRRTPIDLGVALRLAGVDNPTINLAREQVREALAEQLAARSLLLPNVNVGGNYHLHSGPLPGRPGRVPPGEPPKSVPRAGSRGGGRGPAAIPGRAAVRPPRRRGVRTARRPPAGHGAGSDAQAVQNQHPARRRGRVPGTDRSGSPAGRPPPQGETDVAEIARVRLCSPKTGQGRGADANRANARRTAPPPTPTSRGRRRGRVRPAVPVAQPRLRRSGCARRADRSRHSASFPKTPTPKCSWPAAVRARPEVLARAAEIAEAQPVRRNQERVRPLGAAQCRSATAAGCSGAGATSWRPNSDR